MKSTCDVIAADLLSAIDAAPSSVIQLSSQSQRCSFGSTRTMDVCSTLMKDKHSQQRQRLFLDSCATIPCIEDMLALHQLLLVD
jgi:hypothetical protein